MNINKLLLLTILLMYINLTYSQNAIRVNQLGYLPDDKKVAVYLSKEGSKIEKIDIYNALTDQIIYQSIKIAAFDALPPFKTCLRLDFSEFKSSGAFYIQSKEIKSPVFRIEEGLYNETADFLLRYMRQQRCGFNPIINDSCHVKDGYRMYFTKPDSAHIDAVGGWHDASDYLQYVTTSANAVYQMLFAYQQNPKAFSDKFDASGKSGSNHIPDILDEARWGLEWLIKMNPDSGEMYNQIADDRDHQGFRLPNLDVTSYGKGLERPVYFCTGKPQGLFKYKNRTTGIASTAGKFASSFALASLIFNQIDPRFSKLLHKKSLQAYAFGKANPGVCQTAPGGAPYFYEEDNWTDDMELAAIQLFEITKNKSFYEDAVKYGKQEKVTPWMGADTAKHYQWYPFLNLGHYGIAKEKSNVASPEFIRYLEKGLENVFQKSKTHPFLNGIPFIWCSNNLVAAMLTQCRLYNKLTGSTKYLVMETALRDWLLGCNPWGTSMIVGLPEYGDYPQDIHSALSHFKHYRVDGGLVDGPVYASIFNNLKGIYLANGDKYKDLQPKRMVYHDDFADYSTNEPTMDGTASLTYYMSALYASKPKIETETIKGGIVRANKQKKEIALVFTAHEFADGTELIIKILSNHNIKASFFFTGDFYRAIENKSKIEKLLQNGHYLGAHSDKHLLYCSWQKRDSLLVDKQQFTTDLQNNYKEMLKFGVKPENAKYFLPPYEWYNDTISSWSQQLGVKLVNFTSGTSSNQDWTYPDLGKQYLSSDTIYNRILNFETNSPDKLNGFILLSHFGTDPRRTDKFYLKLDNLIIELKKRGYKFLKVNELLE